MKCSRMALAALVFVCFTSSPARAISFSVDVSTGAVMGPLFFGDDIFMEGLVPGAFPPPPVLLGEGTFPVVGAPGPIPIELTGLSFGAPAVDTSVAYFSVDRISAGVAGTAVAAEVAAGPEAASDIFSSTLGGSNTQVFDGNGLPLGPPPLSIPEPPLHHSDVDALDLRFVPPLGAPTPVGGMVWTVDGPTTVLPFSPYAGLGSSPANLWGGPTLPGITTTPGLYLPFTALGLTVADEIDAVVVVEDGVFPPAGPGLTAGDAVYFSLSRTSPSLGLLGGVSPADILVVTGGGPPVPVVFASAASLGLLASDNITALDFRAIPEPATLWMLSFVCLLTVGPKRGRA